MHEVLTLVARHRAIGEHAAAADVVPLSSMRLACAALRDGLDAALLRLRWRAPAGTDFVPALNAMLRRTAQLRRLEVRCPAAGRSARPAELRPPRTLEALELEVALRWWDEASWRALAQALQAQAPGLRTLRVRASPDASDALRWPNDARLPGVTRLQLENCRLGALDVPAVLPDLACLQLHGCEAGARLVAALSRLTRLDELRLRDGVYVDDEGHVECLALVLPAMLPQLRCLRSLALTGVDEDLYADADIAAALAAAVGGLSGLQELRLFLRPFPEALPRVDADRTLRDRVAGLRTLVLDGCELDDGELNWLAGLALERGLPHLRTLHAHGVINDRMQDLGWAAETLADLLHSLPGLTSLDVGGNARALDLEGLDKLAPALRAMRGLRRLGLAHNGIGGRHLVGIVLEPLSALTLLVGAAGWSLPQGVAARLRVYGVPGPYLDAVPLPAAVRVLEGADTVERCLQELGNEEGM